MNMDLPPEQDFSDLGRGALNNLYAARQCKTDDEKLNLLTSVIVEGQGFLIGEYTLKELEWYLLDLWGFKE